MTAVEERTEAPGLRGNWLVGCGPAMQADPLAFYLDAWQKHGDLVRLHLLPGMRCYLVASPDGLEHVLQKHHRNYPKPALFNEPMSRLAGRGLLASEGEQWLRQRRLLQPAFHRQHLARLASHMVAAADDCRAAWDRRPDGTEMDVQGEMMRLTLRIAGMTLLGTDMSQDADELGQAFRTAFIHISEQMNSLRLVPAWVPTPGNRRFARAKERLDRVILDTIAARRTAGAASPSDLLSLLLAAQDEETGVGMTDQQVKDEALTLLTAGHDTVGATLSWTWHLLAQNPAVQEAMADEIRGVLGGRSPSPEDLPRLPLTRAVFDETLRLYPPAWGMPRQAASDDVIGGYRIPKGAIMILSIWVVQRRPDLWPDPEAFRPERFMGDAAASRPRYAYIPFGGGPRVCIGQGFALLEGPLLLATLAQHYRATPVPGHVVTPDWTFTLRPRNGVRVRLHRRG